MRLLATPFDLVTGLSGDVEPIRRKLSAMSGMYADQQALEKMVADDDPIVYEFYDLKVPADAGEIAFGTSITYPGKVGDEYFMTKGHFHSILETAEVYYCLSGKGQMMMENPEGDWESRELSPGLAVYVPARYAHRSINTSNDEPLVTFFAFRGDAGHDYGTIEDKGFRHLVVERDGAMVIVDNPKWQDAPEGRQQ
ncbi:MAG: cupin domain-containing protein [bacterium]|nr:cupin domain-containing protein [bacterium]